MFLSENDSLQCHAFCDVLVTHPEGKINFDHAVLVHYVAFLRLLNFERRCHGYFMCTNNCFVRAFLQFRAHNIVVHEHKVVPRAYIIVTAGAQFFFQLSCLELGIFSQALDIYCSQKDEILSYIVNLPMLSINIKVIMNN